MELQVLIDRAMQIRAQYTALETARHGRSWTDEEIALGFVGDVGDLAKLVIARNGVRAIPDAGAKLAHELSQLYGIDLESSFMKTMDEIEIHIKGQ